MEYKVLPHCSAIVTCGVAASGKTTFSLRFSRAFDAEIVCKDAIYGEMNVAMLPASDEICEAAENRMVYVSRVKLRAGRSIVVDTALLERARRVRVLDALSKDALQMALVVFPDPGESLARERLKRKREIYDRTGDSRFLACDAAAYFRSVSAFEEISESEEAHICQYAPIVHCGNAPESWIVKPSFRQVNIELIESIMAALKDIAGRETF